MLKCLVLTSATGGTAVSCAREFPVVFSVPARWYLVVRYVRWGPVPTCSFVSILSRLSAVLIVSRSTGHCVTYRKQGPDVQMTYRLLKKRPTGRFHVTFRVNVRCRLGFGLMDNRLMLLVSC